MATEFVRVAFHQDTIVCAGVPSNGGPAIIFKHTCDCIGIDSDAQLKRLKRQSWATTVMMDVVAEDGKHREMVAIDRRTFAMWLATIDASRLANRAVAAKVRLYQCEAADVLDRHFFGAPTPTAAPDPGVDHALWQARQFVAILERQADQERRLAALEAATRPTADAAVGPPQDGGSPISFRDLCSDPAAPEGVKLVLRWIQNHPDVTTFPESVLTRDVPPLRRDRAALGEALDWLERDGSIRRQHEPERPKGTRGRKPAPVWEVRPALRGGRPGDRGAPAPRLTATSLQSGHSPNTQYCPNSEADRGW